MRPGDHPAQTSLVTGGSSRIANRSNERTPGNPRFVRQRVRRHHVYSRTAAVDGRMTRGPGVVLHSLSMLVINCVSMNGDPVHAARNSVDTSTTCRVAIRVLAPLFENAHDLVVERSARRTKCYVLRGVLIRRLTSQSGERKNPAAMITATRIQLDTCVATGRYSPSWSHSLLGEFQPRINTIEF